MPVAKEQPLEQPATSGAGVGTTISAVTRSRSPQAPVKSESSDTMSNTTTTAHTTRTRLLRHTVASAVKTAAPTRKDAPPAGVYPIEGCRRPTWSIKMPASLGLPAATPQIQKNGITATDSPSAAMSSSGDHLSELSLIPAAKSDSDEAGHKVTVADPAAVASTNARDATPFPRDDEEAEDEDEDKEEEEEQEQEPEWLKAYNMLRQEDPDRRPALIRSYRHYAGDLETTSTSDRSSGDEMLRQEHPDMFWPYGPRRAYDEYGIELGPEGPFFHLQRPR